MVVMFAKILGILLMTLGAAAFVPSFMNHGLLFNTFLMDPLHNLIFMITGLALASAGFSENWEASRRTILMTAAIFAFFSVMGFISTTDYVLGMPFNMADDVLHLTITVSAMMFGLPERYALPR